MARISPSPDPEVQRERRRERDRANYARNRERFAGKAREWRALDPDRSHANNNASRARNADKVRAYNREWAERNKGRRQEYGRAYRQANREKLLAAGAAKRHGPWIAEDWAAMWDKQGGCCYLCGSELTEGKAFVDHDHRCCPNDRSCRVCRRGIACDRCNVAIGMAADDPDRLRRMAANLEVALRDVEDRMYSAQTGS